MLSRNEGTVQAGTEYDGQTRPKEHSVTGGPKDMGTARDGPIDQE